MEEQKPKVVVDGVRLTSGVSARLAKGLSALAIAFGALPQQLTRTMRSFESTGRIRRKGDRKYPFSSDRQEIRHARKFFTNERGQLQQRKSRDYLTVEQATERLLGGAK
jgi:hypothetical protein